MSLQKFKLLATHCSTVAESPTRSPVIHLRRRKTLRLLLTRSSDRWRLPEIQNNVDESKKTDKRGKIRSSRKLGDLFVSSPPFEESGGGGGGDKGTKMEVEMERDVPVNGVSNNAGFGEEITARRVGFNGSVRPMSSVTLRCRLLRRSWRPVLVTIPEQ
ncbi:hypothetical protein AtNW77_Chr1g0067421 [Arabidopsis thaliana]|uniref:50S ribosomal-like protein n=3 Tax=Arabidopsis TaxID=3701 RepID=Q9C618_ARATH|nr:50S ribosomal-like protein [Arabidopsis thaliana]KAG7650803.1 hypothetical protein ISN45_At01g057380 [Arabidopsis thaliana x Arabidopsis arenosa]AAG50595.1 hypothetical protein [Arabidopsis thaliana]ABG48459.1 At1g66890 [Arabidopsis thaliana]AEE34568.1 50S ribosomal-like protein [Arabidopsis thaliana]OAP19040.1 hypothetical protein AXX17_AT1G60720 [Arabidopsis thaliana]|eukprot:NP_564886.1 50S ribosomal-like protein [Arabidopsis thaliana]